MSFAHERIAYGIRALIRRPQMASCQRGMTQDGKQVVQLIMCETSVLMRDGVPQSLLEIRHAHLGRDLVQGERCSGLRRDRQFRQQKKYESMQAQRKCREKSHGRKLLDQVGAAGQGVRVLVGALATRLFRLPREPLRRRKCADRAAGSIRFLLFARRT